ncbi:MAG: secretin N-terminal domain-containing protein [Verrucomicrobiaceae bacterium]
MHTPPQQAHAALWRIAACLWLLATGLMAQSPAPTTPVKPPTPPAIPRPVLPPGLQRPGMTNPNAIPPAVPGGINRPGMPAGVTSGPQPVSASTATPKPATTPSTPPPATAGVPVPLPTADASTPKPPPIPGNNASSAKPGAKVPNLIAFDAEIIDVVLDEYYRVTKRRVLKDRGLEATTVTIMVPGEFTDEEYQDIIEKGLLMHGLALVPSGPNLWKLVAAETGSSPGQQQLPMVLDPEKLPETDQVVVHVTTLKYLAAEEAANTLQSAIPPHPYGKIVAVPNARSLVITEASQTIRAYLDLIKHLDLPPSTTVQKTIKLIRTDPEDVAKQLESLLDLKSGGGSTGSSSTNRPATPAAAPRAPAIPGIPQQAAQPAAAAAPVVSATGGGATSEGAKPIILPIVRTSSLLIVARPTDIEVIEKLITELDAEATANRFVSRRLNYIDLTTFLGLAEKALMRYDKNAGGSTSTTTGQNSSTNNNTSNNSSFNNFGNSGFGNNSFGNSSFGGGLGGSGFGGGSGFSSGGGPKLDVTTKANSVLIGRTLLIIDPGSSKFFASGPPEQLQTLEDLADELDVRPRQIMISAVIGEFSLNDDFKFGLDWLNTLQNIGGDSGQRAGGGINTRGTFFDPAKLNDPASFLGSTAAAAGGLTAYGQLAGNLHVFMNTVEGSGRFKALQKPVLTTLNHQKAQIYIGEQIPIAGNSFSNGIAGGFTTSTQFIPVRIQLDITPHIFNDHEVMLEFSQTNNSQGDKVTVSTGVTVPGIREQGMVNALIVPDRSIAMLGGLISEDNRNNSSGVPFVVRLPLIKYLFGKVEKTKNRKEIMIFVQPAIMPDGASHMNEQTRFMNNSPESDAIFDFAGRPEEPLPPAPNFYPKDKPRVQTDLDATPTPQPEKRGVLDTVKSWFKKKPKE